MKENKQVKDTILSFLKNKIPDSALMHFQHWLVQDEDSLAKTGAMREIWEEMEEPANESTWRDLNEMHRRIRLLKRKSQPLHLKFLRAAAIVCLPFLGFTAAYLYLQKGEDHVEVVQYYVPKGATKHITLPEGTEIWINSDSYLSFPKKFSNGKRVVNLTGEAFFKVSKDKEKPFIVNTEKMSVEVLGTQFNVNAYPDLSEIKTTLKEGSVAVELSNGGGAVDRYLLTPDEEIALNTSTGLVTKKTISQSANSQWTTGDMTFNSSLMPDILKQLERRYGVTILCPDKYSDKRLTAKLEKEESIDDVLNVLKLLIPGLQSSREDNVIYLD